VQGGLTKAIRQIWVQVSGPSVATPGTGLDIGRALKGTFALAFVAEGKVDREWLMPVWENCFFRLHQNSGSIKTRDPSRPCCRYIAAREEDLTWRSFCLSHRRDQPTKISPNLLADPRFLSSVTSGAFERTRIPNKPSNNSDRRSKSKENPKKENLHVALLSSCVSPKQYNFSASYYSLTDSPCHVD
jgi:hypothetical protein